MVISIKGISFANIFPLIFSLAVDELPGRSNEISGLMITAIIGGALVPLVFGAVADAWIMKAGFVLPLICILYVLYISFKIQNLGNLAPIES